MKINENARRIAGINERGDELREFEGSEEVDENERRGREEER